MESKVCIECKERKSLSKFGKNPKCKDGYKGSCKHCEKVRNSKSKNNKSFVENYIGKVMYGLTDNDY